MSNLSEKLRMLADDLEQRPDEECWETVINGTALTTERAVMNYSPNMIRRKPKMVERTISYPEPMREAPKTNGRYFYPNLSSPDFFMADFWTARPGQRFRFACGLCHTTKEAAISHAKALLGESDD